MKKKITCFCFGDTLLDSFGHAGSHFEHRLQEDLIKYSERLSEICFLVLSPDERPKQSGALEPPGGRQSAAEWVYLDNSRGADEIPAPCDCVDLQTLTDFIRQIIKHAINTQYCHTWCTSVNDSRGKENSRSGTAATDTEAPTAVACTVLTFLEAC